MPNTHSYFAVDKMYQHINKFNLFYDKVSFNDYNSFQKNVSILSEKQFEIRMEELFEAGYFRSCSFGLTSGTTGQAKLLAHSLWRNQNKIDYARQLKHMVQEHIISKTDVVANLFTAGGLSTIYDGCNRLIEGIGCKVLPIGRLDAFSLGFQKHMIKQIKRLKVNVLIGTPSSVIQVLELSKEIDQGLSVDKVVFTGEPFNQTKRNYVKQFWGNVNFFGLYGHSETGFIGFNTSQCPTSHYHIFEDWFFIEILDNKEMLVTSFADELMPIIRYRTGDQVELIKTDCACGIELPIISLLQRSDKKFNYAGNLIESSIIFKLVNSYFGELVEGQIQLNTNLLGKDTFTLVLDKNAADLSSHITEIKNFLLTIEAINEAIQKNAGEIMIQPKSQFFYSERQKKPLVVDKREG